MNAKRRLAALGTWTQVVNRASGLLFMLRSAADAHAAPLVHPSVMQRINAVLTAENYRVQYPAAEDLDLFLRLMERYDCANLPELGLYYELNEGGISATKRRRQITSTLRLQARYLNVLNWRDWAGIAKSLLHFVTPYGALQRVKRAVFARGA